VSFPFYLALALPAPQDFNGDGFADLAVSAPSEDLAAVVDAGAVHVLFGGPGGPIPAGSQFWHQDSGAVLDLAEAGDGFGSALAWGDFNGDGFDDLAIGAPTEGVGAFANAGAVNVLYGGPAGLTDLGNQFWSQDEPGVPDDSETADHFGLALAAGDFDNDGFADLAIGANSEDFAALSDAGAVTVLYGAPAGLDAARAALLAQGAAGVLDAAEGGDRFGSALCAGDFDGDGFADLAVGVPNEDYSGVLDCGAAHVFFGGPVGLDGVHDEFWAQGFSGLSDSAEGSDLFASALEAGDFNGDGKDDLAIGTPRETIGTLTWAGMVQVLNGAPFGLTAAGGLTLTQDSGTIPNLAEADDWFGTALAAADFSGDGFDDLAIGAPQEDFTGTNVDIGVVHVLRGAAGGLADVDTAYLHQGLPVFSDSVERGDEFGATLGAGDFDGDGLADLVIGVPQEGFITALECGVMHVLGLNLRVKIGQGAGGMPDLPETGDGFASAIAR